VDVTRNAAVAIRLEGVRKEYPDGTVAVESLSLDVPAGEIVVLVGPSGCGKSTVLRMLNRLIEPTAGRIVLDGEDVGGLDPVKLRRRIGYVIQNVGLFPHQTISANVGTVPRLLGWPRRLVRARVDELLHLVGLEPARYGGRYPHELSGGQRQRVGVARALAADPVVLLMDEPFSAVDPLVRARLQEEFLRLQRSVRKTVVLVTHDLDEAVTMGDRIALLADRGRLQQYAPPAALLGAPANDFVARFVGADRGIKRLAVTPVPRSGLRPASLVEEEPGPVVEATASLRDALAAILASDRGSVTVVDGDERLGVLTAGDVSRALRRTDPGSGPAGEPAPGVPAEEDVELAAGDAAVSDAR
jgi:osmoprotectant transport system ATP-binding protein